MFATSTIMLCTSAVIAFSFLVIYLKRQLVYAEFADKHGSDVSIFGEINLPAQNREKMTEEAIDKLFKFAEKQRPLFLLGVHTGGRLVSVLINEKLKNEPDKCFFISTDMVPDREPFLLKTKYNNDLGSRVLVVDDVARTGSTLELIRRKFVRDTMSGRSKVRELDFATLIVAAKPGHMPEKSFFVPDWWAFFTNDQDQSLPWSTLSEGVRAAFLNKHKGRKDYDMEMIETHRLLINDYDFALFCARLALNDNRQFEKSVEGGSLRKLWFSTTQKENTSVNAG